MLNKYFAALFIICICVFSSSLNAEDTPSLTLNEAVQMALDRNTAARIAREEVRSAKAQVGIALADRFPQIQVSAEYTHIEDVPEFEIPSSVQDEPSQVFSVGVADNTIITFGANQLLYTGGRVRGQVSQAESLLEGAKARLASTEADVALNTRQAYYAVLLNQGLIKAASSSLEAAQGQLSDATARFEVGTAPRFDVLRAQTQVSEAQQSLAEARESAEISKVALNRIIGASLEADYILAEPGLAPSLKENLPDLIETALKERSDLIASRMQLKAAESTVHIAESARLPQVGLTAAYQAVETDNPIQSSGWTFSASASLELFDGGRINAQVRQAKAVRDQALTAVEDAARKIEQDVREAYLALQTAYQNLDTAKARLDQAGEAYEVAAVRYESGVGTATELADALAALTSARTNVEQSVFKYNLSYARLQRALGRA